MAPSQASSLTELAGSAWGSYKSTLKPLLIGAAIVGVVTAVLQYLMSMQLVSFIASPTVILTGAVIIILLALTSYVSYAYALIVGVEQIKQPGDVVQRAVTLFLPILGVILWTIIRTYIWIPLAGIIMLMFLNPMQYAGLISLLTFAMVVLAVIFGPRFLLAPIVLLQEKLGPKAAVDRSAVVTQGYWGKVLGNIVVVSIVMAILAAIVGSIVGAIGLSGQTIRLSSSGTLLTDPITVVSAVGIVITAGFALLEQGYVVLFLKDLTKTLMANPQKKS